MPPNGRTALDSFPKPAFLEFMRDARPNKEKSPRKA
ncbi:FadR family transcriptional regulator, partial [Mesorhizobium sp. M8A.F.Ca.ET.023.01.1.1]